MQRSSDSRSLLTPPSLFQLSFLFFISFLVLVGFGKDRLQAQQNEKDALIKLIRVQVEDVRGRMYVTVRYRSPLPRGARVRFHLFNSVQRHRLSRKTVSVSEGSGEMQFGPFDDLWKSTYRVETTFKKFDNPNINWEKFKDYQLVSKHKFTFGQNVPAPETQKKQFESSYGDLVRQLRSTFLEGNWKIRQLRKEIDSGNSSNNIGRRKKQITQELNNWIDEIDRKSRAFERKYGVTGCPFSGNIEKFIEAQELLVRFLQKMFDTLNEEWAPPEGKHYEEKSIGQRVAEEIASPEDLRKVFLPRLFTLLSQISDPTRVKFQEISEKIADMLRKSLRLFLKEVKKDDREAKRKLKKERSALKEKLTTFSGTVQNQIDKLFWLFKGRQHLPPEEEELYETARQLRKQMKTLHSVASSDEVIPPEGKKGLTNPQKTLITSFTNLLWSILNNTVIVLDESLALMRGITSDTRANHPRERKKRLLDYMKDQIASWNRRRGQTLQNQKSSLQVNRETAAFVLQRWNEQLKSSSNGNGKPPRKKVELEYLTEAMEKLRRFCESTLSIASNIEKTVKNSSAPVESFDKIGRLYEDRIIPLNQDLGTFQNNLKQKQKSRNGD